MPPSMRACRTSSPDMDATVRWPASRRESARLRTGPRTSITASAHVAGCGPGPGTGRRPAVPHRRTGPGIALACGPCGARRAGVAAFSRCADAARSTGPGMRYRDADGMAGRPREERSRHRAAPSAERRACGAFLRPATIAAGSIAARIRHAAWHRRHPYRPGGLAANPGIAGRPCPAWAWPLAPLHLPCAASAINPATTRGCDTITTCDAPSMTIVRFEPARSAMKPSTEGGMFLSWSP